MNPRKVLPDGARCGDFAAAALGRDGDAAGGHVDLIHPHDAGAVCEALREASAAGTRVLPVGGRQHLDKGNPCEVDAELWTTLLDGIEAYDPAEMLVVVRAGTRVGDLRRELEANGQEWPVDAAR